MFLICKNCGKENKSTNIRCEFCNCKLDSLDNISNTKKNTHGEKFVLLCFLLVFGTMIVYGVYIISSSIHSFVSENKIKNEYNKTNASLIKYVDCHYNDDNYEICSAVYKYEVNDNTYTVSLDLDVVREVYKDNETVYYNPNNPNKAVIYEDVNLNRIFGIIIGIVIICVSIFTLLVIIAGYKMLQEPKKIV